ncbi:MAG: enolase C-terminal domain-like protein [Anaerolineae bacterium]
MAKDCRVKNTANSRAGTAKAEVVVRKEWIVHAARDRSRAKVYASTGEVHPPGQRAEEVLKLHEMGLKTVKLRVHSFDPAEDVRRAIGDDFGIGVDANQGWPVSLIEEIPIWTLDRATDFAKACAELDVGWIEESLDMYAYDEQAELCRRSEVPIAGVELNGGWQEFKVMLEMAPSLSRMRRAWALSWTRASWRATPKSI